ncbi:YjjG family noncanonical pyrimidine nucleotidase [Streptococcus ictaluri]|uniref:YjjG family noncanonical pyrimidine nucleotidase n=1 Tax=Streptococcus ictaluri TaxID=380397 RepID=UPI0002DC78CE|nr:YjjG family noncanonical pyrimidine nucleotidase [Streptococcus ictaluri]
MNYQFLLFDLDHTLLDFDAAEDQALDALLNDYGVEDIQAYKAFYKPMNQALWKALEDKQISKKELVNSRFSRLLAHFGRNEDGIVLANRYQEHLKKQGQSYIGSNDLLARLKQSGYELYAATNGIASIQKERLQVSGLMPYFKAVFVSELSGFQKPDKAFFDWFAAQIPDYDSSKTLMIGDSLTADIQGGLNAGIDTVWFNHQHLSNQTTIQAKYEISSYQELLNLLDS